ncbi:hypothetical protein B0H14DRAFT_3473396 [Mycena olivaceomarginata]|nr:hypothetical protein B0H14DRAFT_3473396 [Mycena olivaceomarginata]
MPAHHWTTLDERAFLTSKIPDFRTAQEGGMLTPFWVELEGAWFLRYPMEAKVGVRAHDVPGPTLTDKENKRLGAATAVQKAQLKAWMGYHSRKLLRAAGASASGSKKKGRSVQAAEKRASKTRPLRSVEIYHKLYMKKIKEEAASGAEEEEEETLARIKEHRKLRMALVRNTVEAMYAAEAEDIKIEIEAETEARKTTAMRAIDQVGEVLKRVTDAIEEETGWHGFFMLGGPMPRQEGEILSKTFCFGGTPEGCDFIATYPNFADVRTGFNQYLKRVFPSMTLSSSIRAGEQEAPAAKPARRKKPAATKKKAPELPAPELPVSTAAIPLTTSPLIVADFGEASGRSGLPLNNGWSSEDEVLTLSFSGDGSVDFGQGPDNNVLESWRSIGFDSAGEDIPPGPSRPNDPAVDIRRAIRHAKDVIKHAMDPPTLNRAYVRHSAGPYYDCDALGVTLIDVL